MEFATMRSRAIRRHVADREKEFVMKMQFVIAAAVAALSSHAVLADPEADFWQQPQAKSSARPTQPSFYGTPAELGSADRIVTLGPGAQSVHVEHGQTVKFIVRVKSDQERSFAWRFDGSPIANDIDLSQVAPADYPVHGVHVFVASDSRSRGG
jgi:Heavy-metal resistance protein CzcE